MYMSISTSHTEAVSSWLPTEFSQSSPDEPEATRGGGRRSPSLAFLRPGAQLGGFVQGWLNACIQIHMYIYRYLCSYAYIYIYKQHVYIDMTACVYMYIYTHTSMCVMRLWRRALRVPTELNEDFSGTTSSPIFNNLLQRFRATASAKAALDRSCRIACWALGQVTTSGLDLMPR